ncbi:hypothetical protein [Oceanobacillus kimchii]|uniref:hypothetical protein n=1 Tax=Oceanobacillus kimchii TaxID=746691 RepID=UPI00098555BC|nr:hypothetical protein [Oceanobacillus kimchii]
MRNEESYKKHMKNVQNETDNPAILEDIIESGMEPSPQYGAQQAQQKNSSLNPLQEVVRNNTDGKTWQELDS